MFVVVFVVDNSLVGYRIFRYLEVGCQISLNFVNGVRKFSFLHEKFFHTCSQLKMMAPLPEKVWIERYFYPFLFERIDVRNRDKLSDCQNLKHSSAGKIIHKETFLYRKSTHISLIICYADGT